MISSNKIRKFLGVTNLTIKVFLGQPMGIVIGLLIPIVLMTILPYVFLGIQSLIEQDISFKQTLIQLMPGLIIIPTLVIGLIGLPLTLSTLKETMIFKKIKMANISANILIWATSFAFFIIIASSTLLILVLSHVIWLKETPNPKGLAIMISWFLNLILTLAIGLTISNFSKNNTIAFAVGVAVFLPFIFLSGVLIVRMIGWIEKFAKIIPNNHLVRLFNVAWFDNNLYIHNYWYGHNYFQPIKLFTNNWSDSVLAYLYPLLFWVTLSSLNHKFFQWE